MTKSELMVKVSSVAGYDQDPENLIKFAEEMWKLAFVNLEPVEQAYLWNKIAPLVKAGEYDKIAGLGGKLLGAFMRKGGRSAGGATVSKARGATSRSAGMAAAKPKPSAAEVFKVNPNVPSGTGAVKPRQLAAEKALTERMRYRR